MHDQWTDRLSDYLDDELPTEARAAVEAHLRTCADCASILEELREVAAEARSLPDARPEADLWPGIERRLDTGAAIHPFRVRMTRRFAFTLPQLAAAALALMTLSGGAVWLAQFGGRATSLPAVTATAPGAPDVSPVMFADPRYDDAVADLQQAVQAGRSKLDPQMIGVLEANLQVIDRAIEQCRRALAADPANVYLNTHLAEAKRRKLALLRAASALSNSQS